MIKEQRGNSMVWSNYLLPPVDGVPFLEKGQTRKSELRPICSVSDGRSSQNEKVELFTRAKLSQTGSCHPLPAAILVVELKDFASIKLRCANIDVYAHAGLWLLPIYNTSQSLSIFAFPKKHLFPGFLFLYFIKILKSFLYVYTLGQICGV